jgi:FkbM family methyltransferase
MNSLLKIYQKIENSLSYLLANRCDEKEFLKKMFNKKGIILVDAGCNLGTYLDLVNKNIKTKKVYIFEPSKICIEYIKNNYKEKKFKIHNLALSNTNKKVKFYEKEITSQSSLINSKYNFINNIRNTSIYKVNCVSIDRFHQANKLDEIYDLVKIDCEGEDFNIIKGAKKLLKKNQIKLLKIEINFKNNNFFEIINYLNRFNYRLITFTKIKFNNKKKIDHLDAYFSK